MNKIMVLKGGSPALHKLGDIGRKEDNLIQIHSETDEYFIGNFHEGYGFIDVKFRKEDVRTMTEEERNELNGTWFGINGAPTCRILIDEDGNIIHKEIKFINGVIDKITDNDGNSKHDDWIGIEVQFQEDIQIGKSLPIFMGERYITTSRVVDVDVKDNKYIIYTKNSVYYIEVN